jgi:curli biogenesis system outer membrane secretion channel CsgG
VVSNLGSSTVSDPFFLHIRVDGEEIAVRPIVEHLSSGESIRVSAEWNGMVGPHTVGAEVDPPIGRIEESDETNNAISRTITVLLSPESAATLGSLKVVVAAFEDHTSSGFLNLGAGIADKVSDRLAGSGVRVLQRTDLESIMQQTGLNPGRIEDLAEAGRLVGADALIAGQVTDVHVVESSLQLGFLSFSGADVDIELSANLVDVYSFQTLTSVSGQGHDDGATGFSVDLGGLLSFLSSDTSDICGGGLQTARSWYNAGESVPLAYHNAGTPQWFSIEVVTAVGGFVKWLGWQYIDTDDCGVWYWDQQDAAGTQMSAGVYAAKIWDGTAYVAKVGFQIRPGISLTVPPVTELTVGTSAFEETVVGGALNHAADDLAAGLLNALQDASPALTSSRTAQSLGASAPQTPEGQVATVLPDGRVAINIGASSGVAVGDVFQVVEISNLVIDPQTLEILSYDTLSIRGTLSITEVRDRVSFGVRQSDFEPVIGDVVREIEP